MTMRRATTIAVAALLAACGQPDAVTSSTTPEILGSTVVGNPDNVLAALVTAVVRHGDSVAVRYAPPLPGPTLDSVTPAVTPEADIYVGVSNIYLLMALEIGLVGMAGFAAVIGTLGVWSCRRYGSADAAGQFAGA